MAKFSLRIATNDLVLNCLLIPLLLLCFSSHHLNALHKHSIVDSMRQLQHSMRQVPKHKVLLPAPGWQPVQSSHRFLDEINPALIEAVEVILEGRLAEHLLQRRQFLSSVQKFSHRPYIYLYFPPLLLQDFLYRRHSMTSIIIPSVRHSLQLAEMTKMTTLSLIALYKSI